MCDLGINESKRLESFDYWGFDKPRPVKVGENQGLLSFGVKKCSRCGEVKRFGEFGLEKKVIDGRQAACRECHKKQGREYCQRPEVKARVKVYAKKHNQIPEVKARRKEGRQRLGIIFPPKACTKCGEVKELGEFHKDKGSPDGKKWECRECESSRQKKYRQKPEVKALQKKSDRERNQRPEVKARDKERYQRPEVKARTRERENERRATDLNFRIAKNLRRRMNQAIKGGDKVGSAVDDLCCSIEEFKAKVARFFKPGMSWDDNWGNGPGKWHLDHIIPLSAFDLTNREQFLSAAHYSNYQPLWSEENLSKGSRY